MLTEGGEGGDFPPTKSQSETAPAEFPAKKLARQLDFTAYAAGASAPVVLPEHPQPPPAQPPVIRPHVVAQMQPPPPPPQQQVLLSSPPLQSQACLSTRPPIKLESPKVRPRTTIEAKESTPKKQKQCNCKHSKCLKLYCECFASGIYCDGCNCVNCHNNVENEGARREAVDATLERNPNAFRPKIANSPHAVRDNREEVGEVLVLGKHNKGCHCKKSGCLKKYCECFQANILCSDLCKCMDCKNYEGSEERQALFHGDHANNLAYLQQAANAAITGAIGSSGYGTPPVSRKRNRPELFFGASAKDQVLHRLAPFPQANHIKASGHSPSTSSIPISRASNSSVGPSKFTYRSLLADMIQPNDVKELVSVLVVYAAEAAKIQTEERNVMEKQADDRTGSSVASAAQDQLSQKEAEEVDKAGEEGDSLSGNQAADKNSPKEESNSDGTDASKERPMSPGTLALMCDEEDTMMFTATTAAKGLAGHGLNTSASHLANGQGMSEVYAEQERMVLTKFRDCLNNLITYGEMKETKYSSLARTEIGDQQQDLFINNGTIHARAPETRNQQQSFSNGGVARSTFPSTHVSLQMNTAATTSAPNNTRSQHIYMSPAKPGL